MAHKERVDEIVSHIQQHPIKLDGVQMYYKKISDLPAGRISMEIAEKIETLDLDSKNKDMEKVVLGLLYLGCGGVDEAHDIVTPYSWSSPTSFSGPPILKSNAKHDASYVHALVHRCEGPFDGEFGNGFNNSTYWFGTVGQHPLFPKVYQNAVDFAKEEPTLVKHMKEHKEGIWRPQQFLHFCENSLQTKDPVALEFCKLVVNSEWQLLFDYCYTKI
eukprot:Phypoly_transcript_19809.p1 GENE.Phypoly_transcript_19809~~Phypoly_transcript_19809.p1  ORF type:complete len:217 (+),score=21.88 Phypoly_transcript_19809:52-702(+)